MIKKLLIPLIIAIVAISVVLTFAGNVLFANILGGVIGAPVKVSRAKLGLSEVGIYGLSVQNPEGFKEKTLASIPEIYIKYDLGSILKNRPHLREIRLNLDEITVEKNAKNQINLWQIGAMKKPAPAKPKTPQAPPKPGEKKAVSAQIDRVDLSLGRARYVDSSKEPSAVRQIPLGIRNAIMNNVTDPKQIIQQIVFRTIQKVTPTAFPKKIQPKLPARPAIKPFMTAAKQQVTQKQQVKTTAGTLSQQKSQQ